LLVWRGAAALGLSALLRVSHLGYDILRFAGASYLIWLGVSSLRLSLRKHASPGTITKSGDATPAWMVAHGVGWLQRSTVQRWLERATGVVLIGFGLRLATETR